MTLRVVVFGLVGSVATVLAGLLLFAPGVVTGIGAVEGLVATLEAMNTRHLLVGTSLLVGLYLTLAARSATRPNHGDQVDAFDEATAEPPEVVTTARQRQTAETLGEQIDAAVAGHDDAHATVRDRLRETATAAYSHADGCSPAAAARAIDRGEWTDDRRAAAFLTDEGGPTHSLWSRLSLWLDPETERRRRIEHAVDATAALTAGER